MIDYKGYQIPENIEEFREHDSSPNRYKIFPTLHYDVIGNIHINTKIPRDGFEIFDENQQKDLIKNAQDILKGYVDEYLEAQKEENNDWI